MYAIWASDGLPQWMLVVRWGWYPMRGVQWNCTQELTLVGGNARDRLCLPPTNAHHIMICGVALPTYLR